MLHFQSFTFNPFAENTYVVYDDRGSAFLIDPGAYQVQEVATLQKLLTEKHLTVEKILLTHAHIDHVLGLQTMYDALRVPVLLHPLEAEILERNPADAARFGFQFAPFSGEMVFVEEGQILTLNEEIFEIFHIPGHSPGSIAFYSGVAGAVISGDALFQGSIGRTDLYKGDHAQLLESIRQKLFTLPADTVVYPGHGQPTQIGFEKTTNPFF